jgi:hypothetical protein
MNNLKNLSIFMVLVVIGFVATSQQSKSFELRYISKDAKANGETDFKGPTSVFDTDQRIEFLKHYADFAADFFEDPNFDYQVAGDAEASQAARQIKPQPEPEHRDRIQLDDWKWLGYRAGQEHESAHNLLQYKYNNTIELKGGILETTSEKSDYSWKFQGQSWRFSFSWKAKVPTTSSKAVFVFSELEKITAAKVGFAENGKLFYTTANGETVEKEAYKADEWYDFKIEFDLAAFNRKKDVVRYNLYINHKLVADYVPLHRVTFSKIAYAPSFASISKINRLSLQASKGVQLDDLWGVGYHLTGRETYPYTVETFLDESFDAKPSAHGWTAASFCDSAWQTTSLPAVHGSERYAEEDLLLRKAVDIGDFDKAYLNIATLDPGGEVWVNGQVAAVITDRAPQKIDLSKFLVKNEENLIAVKVNHFYLTDKVGEIMPHSSLDFNIGWFAGNMSLDLLNYTSIDDVFVYTQSLNEGSALQMAKISIENKFWGAFRGSVQLKMYPWFPKESTTMAADVSKEIELPHLTTELEMPFKVADPKLWSPETPNLYKVHVVLKDDKGSVVDDFVTTTGIRTVDQQGGSFRLNGEISMLNGAQIMGYRGPIEDMVKESRCAPDYWVAKEILQIKKMNGNLLRIHVHNWELPARGINDPRYAQYADQLGMMLLWCPTAWIRTGRGWGDVDFANYPKYMKQVINHPSIVMWEAANHTQSFKGNPVSESNIYCEQVHNTLYPVDPSRIISYNSYVRHLHYGNDEGTIDQQGKPIKPTWAWTAANVTRGNQDSPTGYGKEWDELRNYPGDYRASFLDSKYRAYFNFEHQESMAQPNWDLVKGKPWYKLHSYEWDYDEGSIGRRLTYDEWKESQAWQAFGAWEAMKKMRFLDYDGFSWCCLHGGANSVTYKKPLIDFTGAAKLAWHANKMVFQKTVAGSHDVDVVYGPADKIKPVVMNWDNEKTANVTVKIVDLEKNEVARKEYKNVALKGGRTVNKLEPFMPTNLGEGYYFVVYEIE